VSILDSLPFAPESEAGGNVSCPAWPVCPVLLTRHALACAPRGSLLAPSKPHAEPAGSRLRSDRVSHGDRNGKTTREYGNKQVVFSQGDAADAVFYIQTGKVQLTVVSPRGKEAVIGVLERGSFFGEGCLAAQPLRTSTACATQPSSLIGWTPAPWCACSIESRSSRSSSLLTCSPATFGSKKTSWTSSSTPARSDSPESSCCSPLRDHETGEVIPKCASSRRTRASRFSLELKSWSTRSSSIRTLRESR